MNRASRIAGFLTRLDRSDGKPRNAREAHVKQLLQIAGAEFLDLLNSGAVTAEELAETVRLAPDTVEELAVMSAVWALADETGLSPRDLRALAVSSREAKRVADMAVKLRTSRDRTSGQPQTLNDEMRAAIDACLTSPADDPSLAMSKARLTQTGRIILSWIEDDKKDDRAIVRMIDETARIAGIPYHRSHLDADVIVVLASLAKWNTFGSAEEMGIPAITEIECVRKLAEIRAKQ